MRQPNEKSKVMGQSNITKTIKTILDQNRDLKIAFVEYDR